MSRRPPARRRVRRERDEFEESLYRLCDDPAVRAEFRRELAYARKSFTVLEEHNHAIDQLGPGLLRRAALAAGQWLVRQGTLEKSMDVCWLSFEEILAALRGDSPNSLAGMIARRQARHAKWERLTPPPILGLPDPRLPQRPPWQDDVTPGPEKENRRIVGLAASPGRHTGRARVVLAPSPLPDLSPGDVLVSENAGPLWTPLLPILGGLVLDQGSLGQHAAATAREYGVPAVVATGDGTRRIPDWALVTVDGTAGFVEIKAPVIDS